MQSKRTSGPRLQPRKQLAAPIEKSAFSPLGDAVLNAIFHCGPVGKRARQSLPFLNTVESSLNRRTRLHGNILVVPYGMESRQRDAGVFQANRRRLPVKIGVARHPLLQFPEAARVLKSGASVAGREDARDK